MIVVSDSGPIIHLGAIGHAGLIQQIFGDILIPAAVYHEVAEVGAGLPGSAELKSAPWARVEEPIRQPQLVKLIEGHLDPGEVDAILLALERKAGLLLVDDLAARTVAARVGLSVVGTLGILLTAKARGLVETIEPLLRTLVLQGFWMSSSLQESVLISAGELSQGGEQT